VAGSAHTLGGLASWLDSLLPGLAARGWDPVLGLVEGPRHHRPDRLIDAHPQERWIRIPCATGTPEGRCRALTRALADQRPAAALAVNIPDLFPALYRVRKAGSPMRGMMTVHGIEPELYADAHRFRGVIDGAVGTNRLACRLLETLGGIEATRVLYAPYGVDPVGPRERTSPADGSSLRIGYAGRLEQSQKRVRDLPRISRALDRMGTRHEWRIAGGGPEESGLRRDLPAGRAVFLGAVPGFDLAALLYREVDALVVPSRWETGPLVVWEAMAAGVPVVASRYLGSGLEDALRDEENALLFDGGDADAAARQLARLARDPALADRLAAAGRELARARYSRERSIDAWERAIESVLALPPLPPGPAPEVPPATGRLERLAGPRWSESVRRALGRTGPDSGSGGEWPHAYGPGLEREEFFRIAAEADRSGRGAPCSQT
jgi:glycosyltransferase involved in cell wall biosynthesis